MILLEILELNEEFCSYCLRTGNTQLKPRLNSLKSIINLSYKKTRDNLQHLALLLRN